MHIDQLAHSETILSAPRPVNRRPQYWVYMSDMWIDLNANPVSEVNRIQAALRSLDLKDEIGVWDAWLKRHGEGQLEISRYN